MPSPEAPTRALHGFTRNFAKPQLKKPNAAPAAWSRVRETQPRRAQVANAALKFSRQTDHDTPRKWLRLPKTNPKKIKPACKKWVRFVIFVFFGAYRPPPPPQRPRLASLQSARSQKQPSRHSVAPATSGADLSPAAPACQLGQRHCRPCALTRRPNGGHPDGHSPRHSQAGRIAEGEARQRRTIWPRRRL
jgi:hypothetical protein